MKVALFLALSVCAPAQIVDLNSTDSGVVSRLTINSNFHYLDGRAGVTSFNSRTGAISPTGGDYTCSLITSAACTTGSYADPSWITSLAWSKISSVAASNIVSLFSTCSGTQYLGADGACHSQAVSSVFGRTGAVTATSGDYSASQITNAVANNAANTYTGGGLQDLSAVKVRLGKSTVAGLPAASSNTDVEYLITDAVDPTDCTTGSGTSRAWCVSNGTAWMALASSVSAGVASLCGATGSVTLPITCADVSTPANPSSGNTKVYTKAGKVCSLDPSGNENCAGSGGSTYPLTFIQEMQTYSAGNTSSFTVTFPQATASSGNTAFMIVATDGSASVGLPMGWTADLNVTQATYSRFILLHKATASDTSATFTLSTSSISVYFFEVSGSHALDQSSTGGEANADTIPFPSITPTANSVVFSFAALVLASSAVVPSITTINPAWRGIVVQNTTNGAGGFRTLIGWVATSGATNVATKPPRMSLQGTSLFGSGGIAYSTFSIL